MVTNNSSEQKMALETLSRSGNLTTSGHTTTENVQLPSEKIQPHETPKLEFKDNNTFNFNFFNTFVLHVQWNERIVSNETSIGCDRLLHIYSRERNSTHCVPS
jgi:hypothetical protein